MNRNICVDTQVERLYIFHQMPYCILMRHPNTRNFNEYHFEVFEASQYGNEEVYACFSIPRQSLQKNKYETDGQACEVRLTPEVDVYKLEIEMSNSPSFSLTIDKAWIK